MTGGLIELATYGNKNLYLTGTPEITYFKVVYRKHTKFSIESKDVEFNDTVKFGKESTLSIKNIGDLMYKCNLEIEIPRIELKRSLDEKEIENKYELVKEIREDNTNVRNFVSINRLAYTRMLINYDAENKTINNMQDAIDEIYNKEENIQRINLMAKIINKEIYSDAPFTIFKELSLKDNRIIDELNNPYTDLTKDRLFKEYTNILNKTKIMQDYFRKKLEESIKDYQDERNNNIKFAWTENLGHSIIEYVEIKIGGTTVDKIYGEWIDVKYELEKDLNKEKSYDEMIGNVDKLIKFDRNIKPKYKLVVPLPFWFTKSTGLAIPLVALQYQDVTFNVKFRDINDVSYIEENEMIKINNLQDDEIDNITLKDVPSELNLNINAKLRTELIYLEDKERKRFAKSINEYLIEQLQILEIKELEQKNINILLDNFVHPCKNLIWIVRRNLFIDNFEETNKTYWTKYTIDINNEKNPIVSTSIDFSNHTRVTRENINYFNYLQPYEAYNSTPKNGINLYSYSLFPSQTQPSGSANYGSIPRVVLNLEMKQEFMDLIKEENDTYDLIIYTENYNILRFVSGYSGLAWSYN